MRIVHDRRLQWLCILGMGVCLLTGSIVYAAGVLSAPLKGMIVYIDAGHGGFDPGAIGITDTQEKDLNLAIARFLQGYLETGGATVYMTRIDDEDLAGEASDHKKRQDMQNRMKQLSDSDADLMISIHQNSYTDSRFWGPQVFCNMNDELSKELALSVQDALNSFTSPENTRVIKDGNSYYVLKNSPVPAVLVECGFITNAKEEQLLNDEEYQKKVAWGIYSGIMDSYGRE